MKRYNNLWNSKYKEVQKVAIFNFGKFENFNIGIWNYIGSWFPMENMKLVFKTKSNWKLIEKF